MKQLIILLKSVLLLAALIALSAANPSATAAQTTCDQVVLDRAEVLTPDGGRVHEAAERLSQSGAEVRIRTVTTYAPASSIDAFAEQLISDCAAWHDPSGERTPNLLLVLIAVEDRQTGIYYGARWNSALDDQWLAIQTNQMNPRFRDGDFAGGVVAGLEAIEQRIAGSAAPPIPAGAAQQPSNTQPVVPVPAAASDEGTSIPFGGLGLLLLITLLGGGAFGLYKYQQERKRRQAAQQQARLAKQQAVEYVITLPERVKHLEVRVKNTMAQVSAEDAEPLIAALAGARQITNTMLLDFGQLDELDPERRRLSVAEYEQIAAAHNKVCETARQATEAVEHLEAQLATLDAAIQHTPQAIADGKQAIEQAATTIAAIAAEGFKTQTAQQVLSQAQTSLTEAEQALEERRFTTAAALTGTAAQQTQAAANAAQSLPQLKQQAETAAVELAQRIERVAALIGTGRRTLEAISQLAASQCWYPVRDHPHSAEQRVVQCQQTLDTVRGLITMQQQAWPQALEQLAAANQRLDEAEQLIAAITTLQQSLDAAIRDAPRLIEQTQMAITAAEEYVRRYDADIRDSIWAELHAATDQLEANRAELRNAKPDYLQVVAQVQQVLQTTNGLHQQAQAEHEAQERLRQQARDAQNQAQWMIRRAYDYIDSNSRDVAHSTRAALAGAEQYIAQAASAAALEMQISYAKRALEEAQRTYERAQHEVAEAEAARRRERELQQAARAAARRRSSGGSSSWGSSGGGSSSWRSSGGGSSSWGSSGGKKGGGGSSGW